MYNLCIQIVGLTLLCHFLQTVCTFFERCQRIIVYWFLNLPALYFVFSLCSADWLIETKNDRKIPYLPKTGFDREREKITIAVSSSNQGGGKVHMHYIALL